jgi:hypothetical protein
VQGAALRGLRDLLIGILGVAIGDSKEKKNGEMPLIVPLAYLLGNPEVLQHYSELAERRDAEESSVDDADFDRFSRQLQQQLEQGYSDLPGDMVPLLTEDLKDIERNSYWHSEAAKVALKSLGIKPRSSSAAVPHVKARPAAMQDRSMAGLVDESELETFGEVPSEKFALSPEEREAEIEKFRRALAEGDDG